MNCKEFVLLFSILEIKPTSNSEKRKITDDKNMRQLSADFISFHMVLPAVYSIL